MQTLVLRSLSPADTESIATRIAEAFPPGRVLALDGQLGAGKTCFSQGFAAALGIAEPVSSPSYALIQEYAGPSGKLVHMDWYRMKSEAEIEDIGVEEYFRSEARCLVEWASRGKDLLPENAVHLDISVLEDGARRLVLSLPEDIAEAFREALGPWGESPQNKERTGGLR